MKRKKAVAISYDKTKDNAPRILAKGEGTVAQQILEIAKESNVPTSSNPVLVNQLALLDLGSEIPEDLYQVVAEILVFVHDLTSA